MATVPPPLTPTTDPTPSEKEELIIYSRSNLFYWWPLWAFGFVFAIWSQFSDNRMVIVPKESRIVSKTVREGDVEKKEWEVQIAFPDSASEDFKAAFIDRDTTPIEPGSSERVSNLRVSRQAWMAPIFFLILLLTIIITNVPLRGLWSVIVIISIITISILFALFDIWDTIFLAIGNVHVYINMGGYLFVASVAFIVWAAAFFFFDRRTYVAFTAGQVRVREEIGGREKTYDTIGMTSEKHRDDIFKHYVLGLGSGDLTIRPAGQDEIRIPNVLLIGGKLSKAQTFLRRQNPTGSM